MAVESPCDLVDYVEGSQSTKMKLRLFPFVPRAGRQTRERVSGAACIAHALGGLEGLLDRAKPGRPRKLDAGQEKELSELLMKGPDPDKDGVSAYTLDDLVAIAESRWKVKYYLGPCRSRSSGSASRGKRRALYYGGTATKCFWMRTRTRTRASWPATGLKHSRMREPGLGHNATGRSAATSNICAGVLMVLTPRKRVRA